VKWNGVSPRLLSGSRSFSNGRVFIWPFATTSSCLYRVGGLRGAKNSLDPLYGICCLRLRQLDSYFRARFDTRVSFDRSNTKQ